MPNALLHLKTRSTPLQYTLTLLGLGLFASLATASTEPADCELGARYELLAARAAQNLEPRKQLELLEKSVSACESYSAYIELGTTASGFANNARSQRAAEAFSRAYELATGSREEAMAIFGYAQLLHHTNNNQQALRYAYAARNLQPEDPEIAALAKRVASDATTITEEQIVRGFGRLALKPLQLKTNVEEQGQSTGGAGSPNALPSVNIPLQFEFGTTRLTRESTKNVQALTDALTNHYTNRDILFVGHADVRGTPDYNMALSINRAQAIQREVVKRSPALTDKISIVGKGESVPLSGGDTESDHSVNRRLEIVIQ